MSEIKSHEIIVHLSMVKDAPYNGNYTICHIYPFVKDFHLVSIKATLPFTPKAMVAIRFCHFTQN